MNKLSYGLLSLLSIKPQTGYDLKLAINKFWHANHSAIYPLLSELEKKEYVKYKLVDQQGKPDKKIYGITDAGIIALKEWITSPLDDAIIKDEMMLKVYCIEALDHGTIETLIDQAEARYQKQLDRFSKHFEIIKSVLNDKSEVSDPSRFGSFLLIQKVIADAYTGLKWCKWLRELYTRNRELNFTGKDLNKLQTDFLKLIR